MTQVLEITLFQLCLVAMQTEKLRRWLFMYIIPIRGEALVWRRNGMTLMSVRPCDGQERRGFALGYIL